MAPQRVAGERRQVGLQGGEIAQRDRAVRLLAAAIELLHGQPADRRVVAQGGDGALAIGVCCAEIGHTGSIVNA